LKLADISGKKEFLNVKIEALENNSNIKCIMDLYRGINDFRKSY
jgi:hypothetical protein